jgi:hypothetical protein
LLVLFHVKFADCKIDVAAFPINIWFANNVVVSIPPRVIDNAPDAILAFKAVILLPTPTKLVADKVFFVLLFHIKFAVCKIDVAALPINICPDDKVGVPIPPRAIDNLPHVILDEFNVDKLDF